jgi:hypothetical protein
MKYLIISFFFCVGTSALAQDYLQEKYLDITVLGWNVKVNTKLISGDTSVLKKCLGLFGKELSDISQALPGAAVERLKKEVTFWIEIDAINHTATGEYNPSREWLSSHGENPDKAGGIEIAASAYIDQKGRYSDWVILHELAHAYHHKVIGYDDDEEITRTFKVIKGAGLYNNVRFEIRKIQQGYAGTSPHEYFAEITTKYFGHSYYFPNDRSDLKHYDILGYKLVEKMWKVSEK